MLKKVSVSHENRHVIIREYVASIFHHTGKCSCVVTGRKSVLAVKAWGSFAASRAATWPHKAVTHDPDTGIEFVTQL